MNNLLRKKMLHGKDYSLVEFGDDISNQIRGQVLNKWTDMEITCKWYPEKRFNPSLSYHNVKQGLFVFGQLELRGLPWVQRAQVAPS